MSRAGTLARTLALGLGLAVLASGSARAASPFGDWLAEDGEAVVRIEPCGERLCGAIVWLKEPLDDSGRPIRDNHNGDFALRDRPILGLTILRTTRPEGPDGSGSGTIYDPESGNTYKAVLRLETDDRLGLRGYVGVPLFGRTEIWTRMPPAGGA